MPRKILTSRLMTSNIGRITINPIEVASRSNIRFERDMA
jgi:hypothetical protein